LDSSDNLYVADFLNNEVDEFAPPYNALTSTLGALNRPEAVIVDASGKVIVANTFASSIVESSPFPNAFTALQPNVGAVNGFYIDASSNLYFSNGGTGKIQTVAPPYTVVPTTLQTGFASPQGVVVHSSYNATISP
jgi:streptogramin lyase